MSKNKSFGLSTRNKQKCIYIIIFVRIDSVQFHNRRDEIQSVFSHVVLISSPNTRKDFDEIGAASY